MKMKTAGTAGGFFVIIDTNIRLVCCKMQK